MKNNTPVEMKKTYLLVHGAWHGAWCWDKVKPMLQARGYKAIAVELPGHGSESDTSMDIGLKHYVDAVVQTANTQNGPVILVGHSMAGIIISQAAEQLGGAKVSSLVYLDAFIPGNGASLMSLVDDHLKQLPPGVLERPGLVHALITSEDGKTNSVRSDMASWLFYHDCSEADTAFALARMTKEPIAPLATPLQLSDEVYGSIPKYYILCTESKDLDKTFMSDKEPFKKVYRLASSHSPFFSMPEKLVDIFAELR